MGSVRFESAQPAYSIGGISRNDIQKCPEYFSDRMGGCVPSGAWLIDMFCSTLKKRDSTKILSVWNGYETPRF